MIVKNEESNLIRCLDSVRDLAGEYIVVDTGSTDATPQIAARLGAQVIPFDFTFVDFSAARNCALSHARGRWILMLDADEALDRATAPLLESIVALGGDAGYFLERRNYSAESEVPTVDYVVRLFRNRPNHRFRGRVHETIDASILEAGGRLQKSGIRIDHNFSLDAPERRRKNLWYIDLLMQEIAANPRDDSRLDFLAAEYHQLKMFDRATEIAERIARARPKDPRAHLFVGIYHLLYQSDPARAKTDFETALTLHPKSSEAQRFLRLCETENFACSPSG